MVSASARRFVGCVSVFRETAVLLLDAVSDVRHATVADLQSFAVAYPVVRVRGV